MFGANDDGGFKKQSASGLNSLFGDESGGQSQSLQYHAPTNKAASPVSASSSAAMALVHATKAQCFLYDAATAAYTTKGAVGVAVVQRGQTFQLIVYYSASQQLCQADLTSQFAFTLQADGYAAFVASGGQTYSIKFASVAESAEFAQFIALGKSGSSGWRELVVQELAAGAGAPIRDGDVLGLQYTAYAVGGDGKLGRQIEATGGKVKKVVLGNDRGVVIGLHSALNGMRRGGVRFAVLPPPHSPDGVRAYRVELSKVKRSTSSSLPDASASPIDGQRGAILDRMKNIAVQAWPDQQQRGSHRTSATSHEDEEDDVVQHIGNAVTPYQPQQQQQQQQQQQDAEVRKQMEAMKAEMDRLKNEAEVERRVREAQEKAREESRHQVVQQHQQHHHQPQPIVVPYGANYNPYVAQQPQPTYAPVTVAQAPQSTASDAVQHYVETKEWRRHMDTVVTAMASKVEVVHSRIENSFLGAKGGQEESMTGGTLMKALRRLVDENEQRGVELADKNERLDALRASIAVLHDKHEKLLDERNRLLEGRNDVVRETTDTARKAVAGLQTAKEQLESELLAVQDKLSKNKRKTALLERTHEAVRGELDTLRDEHGRLTSSHTSQGVELEDVKAQLRKERDARRTLELDKGRISEMLEEERAGVARLTAQLEARKQGYAEQSARTEAAAAEAVAAARAEVAQVQAELRAARLNAGTLSAEGARRLEQQEESHRAQLDAAVSAARLQATRDVEAKARLELAEAVSAAESRVDKEVRAAFHASNPMQTEVDGLKIRLQGAQDALALAQTEAQSHAKLAQAAKAEAHAARLESQAKGAATTSATPTTTTAVTATNGVVDEAAQARSVVDKTKAVMSKLYHVVTQKIPAAQTFQGSEVHTITLACIKSVTAATLAPLEEVAKGAQSKPPVTSTTPPPVTSTTPPPVTSTTPPPVTSTTPPPVAASAVVGSITSSTTQPTTQPTVVTPPSVVVANVSPPVSKSFVDPLSTKHSETSEPPRSVSPPVSKPSFIDPLSSKYSEAAYIAPVASHPLSSKPFIDPLSKHADSTPVSHHSTPFVDPLSYREEPVAHVSNSSPFVDPLSKKDEHVHVETAKPTTPPVSQSTPFDNEPAKVEEEEEEEEQQQREDESTPQQDVAPKLTNDELVAAEASTEGEEEWDDSENDATEPQQSRDNTPLPTSDNVIEERKEEVEEQQQQVEEQVEEKKDEVENHHHQQHQVEEQQPKENQAEEQQKDDQNQHQDQQHHTHHEIADSETPHVVSESVPHDAVVANAPLPNYDPLPEQISIPDPVVEKKSVAQSDNDPLGMASIVSKPSSSLLGNGSFMDSTPTKQADPSPPPVVKPSTPKPSTSALWGDEDDTEIAPPAPAPKVAVKQSFSSLFDDDDAAPVVASPAAAAAAAAATPTKTPSSSNKSRGALFSDDEDDGANFTKPAANKGAIDDSLFKF